MVLIVLHILSLFVFEEQAGKTTGWPAFPTRAERAPFPVIPTGAPAPGRGVVEESGGRSPENSATPEAPAFDRRPSLAGFLRSLRFGRNDDGGRFGRKSLP